MDFNSNSGRSGWVLDRSNNYYKIFLVLKKPALTAGRVDDQITHFDYKTKKL